MVVSASRKADAEREAENEATEESQPAARPPPEEPEEVPLAECGKELKDLVGQVGMFLSGRREHVGAPQLCYAPTLHWWRLKVDGAHAAGNWWSSVGSSDQA